MSGVPELERAVAALCAGEAIGFPTETVYGLGADAGRASAVERIFALKGRPAAHPLIVHLHDTGDLERWASGIPAAARRLAARFWPGPLTLILPRAPGVLASPVRFESSPYMISLYSLNSSGVSVK